MDLAIGAKQTFVMMNLLGRDGTPKLVAECTYPLTGVGCVSRVYTDLAVFLVTAEGLVVRDTFGTDFASVASPSRRPRRRRHRTPPLRPTTRTPPMAPQVTTTEVAIVGGGPAGLMLSHLLSLQGIDSVVVDDRTRAEIEKTVRAGILERDSVRLLVESGVSDAVLTEGDEHRGIDLAFGGAGHRIDFQELVGASVWLYPQTSVFRDLAAARDRAGGDVRFGVTGHPGRRPAGPPRRPVHRRRRRRAGGALPATWSAPTARAACAGGRCPRRSGASTSASTRSPGSGSCARRRGAPPSWSTATPTAGSRSSASAPRRCSACTSSATRTRTRTRGREDRIWSELQARVGPNGYTLQEGPITSTSVLRFRSFVHEPMRHRNLLLAGDAAHTVPPTGAKGLNLALADVRVLAEVLERALRTGDGDVLDEYTDRALARVWKAQHFSYWMTTMLHRAPDAGDFDVRRQVAELGAVVGSRAASTYLAEGYTGWPTGEGVG